MYMYVVSRTGLQESDSKIKNRSKGARYMYTMGAPRSCCSAPCLLLVVALVVAHCCGVSMASCSFTISNYCPHPIWPATMSGAGTPQLPTTGFRLDPGQTVQVPAPTGWSGRIWARTGCDFGAGGVGAGAVACQTGDCGGRMECGGTGGTPPATLFEITLGKGVTAADQDYYDVSLIDGYNLPVVAVPRARQGGGGGGACNATGCAADLNLSCPKELQVDGGGGGAVGCRSACEAFGQDKYCCSGAYATPATCRPTAYSSIFKSACPRAYSYAYDDGTSIFTCNAVDYTIAFCIPPTGPPAAGQSNGGDTPSTPPPDNNGSGSTYPPPPTGSNDAGSTYPPPPAGSNGAGSAYPPPPAGSNGAGSAYLPPLSGNNGAGSAYLPPPGNNNGAGSAYQPPLTYNSGVRSAYEPPWTMPSAAATSTRYNQLRPLLPAVLFFLI